MPNHNLAQHVEDMNQMIEEGYPLSAIAKKYGCEFRAVKRALTKAGISWSSKTGPKFGDKHPRWNGGRVITQQGYAKIHCPDHPYCQEKPWRNYIEEHRLVMESHIGRCMKKGEVVHHKNGDKLDNRIENLELFSSNAEHLKVDLKGKVPNWTPDGIRAMRHAADAKRSNLPQQSLSNDRRYIVKTDHSRKKLDTSDQSPSQTERKTSQ